MSKEFDNIQQTIAAKKAELANQARIQQQKIENEKAEAARIQRQKELESERRSAENKKIFEDNDVVKLFQELIDKKIVVANNEPLYERRENFFGQIKETKVSNCHQALIKWGDECKSISLLFNIDEGRYHYHDDRVTLEILDNKKIGINGMRIANIPNYIGEEISKTLN